MNPIAVLSFNRPDYLRQTLRSLALQEEVHIDKIALFQDGLYNPYSGKKYGDDSVLDEQIKMFKTLFPHGEVFVAEYNLGVARNIRRAEDWVFSHLLEDGGYFFEDDMVLSPHYLASLNNMLDATADDERVGYCACYGSLWPAPKAAPNTYVPMHMNWAFALRRSQWLKSKPYMDAYYNLLIGSDYRDRPMGKIMALREAWGLPGVYTTQDVMHTLACLLTGGIKLCSYARLGKYIGARGLHIDEATYESAGFGKIELYPNKLEEFGPVTNELVNWCREVHCRFTGVKEALCQQ